MKKPKAKKPKPEDFDELAYFYGYRDACEDWEEYLKTKEKK